MLHRLAAAVAAMAASAGGLDALAFTAGIGEGSVLVRERLSARLGFLGVDLDPEKNHNATPDCDVAKEGSQVRILVVRAREELVAARAAQGLLASDGDPA
jgi:acetate kinase